MAILAKGVRAADFSAAMTKFEGAIGKEWVFTKDEDIALYRDAFSPLWGEPNELLTSAAVAPASVEQVQQIVHIANEHKIPLFPISTGRNLGYGGSSPNLSGSVIVDLRRMNRVLEVDDKRNFALVEPGVSYFDLYRHIQEKKLKVWIDCPDPGWGSPLGNALDHGVGYTYGAFRDHFGSHCGMEVVLPNGEVMRTGMGALPGAKSWQEYRYGFGPTVDGLFAQGNYGIVTKMGFWLLPQPEAYLTGVISVPKRRDLIPLIEHVNYLEDSGLIGQPGYGSPLGGGPGLGRTDPELASLLAKPEGPSDAELDGYAARKGSHVWRVELKFYGPAKTVQANWEYAKERLSQISGAKSTPGELLRFPLTREQEDKFPRKVAIGIPNLTAFMRRPRSATDPTPSDGHLWFAAVIPRTGEAVFEAQRVMTKVYREVGVDVGGPLQLPATWHPRTFIMLVGFPLSRADPEVNKRSRLGFERVVQVSAEHGWGEYRAPPAFQDIVANAYSYNNHSYRRFCETLKDAVDPNGILAAGRGGVWPRHLRGNQA